MEQANTTEKTTFSISDFFGLKQIASFASLVVSLAVIMDYITVTNLFNMGTGVFITAHPVLNNPIAIALLTLLPALTIIFSIFLTMFAFFDHKYIEKFYDNSRFLSVASLVIILIFIHLHGFVFLDYLDHIEMLKNFMSFIMANIVIVFLICYLFTIYLFGLLGKIIETYKNPVLIFIFTIGMYLIAIVISTYSYERNISFIFAFFSTFSLGIYIYYKYIVIPILEKNTVIKERFKIASYSMIFTSFVMLGTTYINFDIWKDELKPDWSIGIINKKFMLENKQKCTLIGAEQNITISKFDDYHKTYFLRIPMAENIYWFFENDVNTSIIKVSVAEKQSDNSFQLIDMQQYEKNTQ